VRHKIPIIRKAEHKYRSVVLYICVMISLLLIFYISQALFCISVFCFPYYWYFMSHKCLFVYLCYDFPIIGILCFTSVVLYICVINYREILTQIYKTTLVRHKIPIIRKAEHKYRKQLL
jgi:hypothetical protein